MKRKIMTLVGTRPEVIKLSRVIAELDRYAEHTLVHTGQNFDHELNQVFFDDLGIRSPDHFLDVVGDSTAATIGNIITKSDEVFAQVRPDALLLYGDTNSCLSVMPAKRRKIPVFHMEAGNRCFDSRVPEELNRKVVDHLSDINMPLTEHARRYLLAEGLRPETVIKIGSPMMEVLHYHRAAIETSDVLDRLGLARGSFFLVSAHREENVDSDRNLDDLVATLHALHREYNLPVIVSTHPRTRNRLTARGIDDLGEGIRLMKPLGFFDYVRLQTQARCVLSDSGTITEESSLLGFPAVTIRKSHERPEGMDEGVLIMCGLAPASVLNAVSVVIDQGSRDEKRHRIVDDYDVENVSRKVVRIILSYIDYVNEVVWKKI